MAYPQPFLDPLGQTLGESLGSLLPAAGQTFDVTGLTPKVSAVSPLIQAAQQRTATQAGLGTLQFSPDTGAVTGVGQGTGIAAYQPYLQRAETLLSPTAYQQYMSPYQTEVIDATQRLLNEQRASGRSQLAANAIQAGAYGGGRSGIAQAEYERQRDVSDAALLAGLRQQGLSSAQQLQQQGIANLTAFPKLQQQLESGVTSQLGATGAGAQQYSQSVLDALTQGAQYAQQFPFQQLGQATNIFASLAGSVPSAVYTPPFTTSPGLAGAQSLASIYGALSPRQQQASGGIMSLLGA